MGYLEFLKPPRTVGNPQQVMATTEEEIQQFVEANSGKAPVFVSHNRYPTFEGRKPYQVEVSKLFIDLDAKKVENAQLDARKLIKFFDDQNIPYYVAFSGSKGFHFYVLLKPQTFLHGKFLKKAIRATLLWLSKTLELRTLDERCTDPTRLCRVWYTPHVTHEKKTGRPIANGNYCCPLLPEWVNTWNIEDIIAYAKKPTLIHYEPLENLSWQAEYMTLTDLIDYLKIDLDKVLDDKHHTELFTKSKISKYVPVADEFVKQVIPRPCIHSRIVHDPNPPHIIRFAAVVQLKKLGYDPAWIFNFIQGRNYIDKHNVEKCVYQINHIYNHRPSYKHPTCETLYNYGLCIGKECPRYRE